MTNQNKSRVLIAGMFVTVGSLIVAPMVLPRDAAQIFLGVVGAVSFAAVFILTPLVRLRDRKANKPVHQVPASNGIQVLGTFLSDAEGGDDQ